jgi:hypothetical protein
MANAEGFGKGKVTVNYPGTERGTPLLSSFYFRFQAPGSSAAVDNHLNILRVMPPGNKTDLTPTADLPLDIAEVGKISLMYADKDADSGKDNYFYKVAHAEHTVARFQMRDVGCTGRCEQVIQLPGVQHGFDLPRIFVLVGFQLFFTGARDHHMDEIAVYEDGGKLVVRFNDKNDDDVFGYFVDFAMLRPLGVNVQQGEESGRARGGVRIPVLQGPKVICGFHFDYRSSDHHIREVGVLSRANDIEVYYGDKNGDDAFNYRVKWASITPIVASP